MIIKKIKENKIHIYLLSILFIIAFLTALKTYQHGKVPPGDTISKIYYTYPFVKNTILKYHQFPHWFPHHMAGIPFFPNVQNTVIYITTLMYLFMPVSIETFLFFLTFFVPFLGGCFMYALMIYLIKKPSIAFVSALIFMSNGLLRGWSFSWEHRASAFTWIPLIILFLFKANYSKKWFKYSVIIGILLAFEFFTEGAEILLFTSILFILFFIYFSISKNVIKRGIKLSLIYLVFGLLFFGLISIKLLPMLEFNKVASKKFGFSYKDYIGRHYKFNKDLLLITVLPTFRNGGSRHNANIGFMGTLLVFLSLFLIKKKKVLFFWILALFTLLVATGTFINYPLWKFIPGFSKMHHVTRSIPIFIVAFSILTGFGLNYLVQKILKPKLNKKMIKYVYLLIILIIIIELCIIPIPREKIGRMNFREQIMSNELMQYLHKDKDIFRINNYYAYIIGGYTSSYMVHLNLQMLYGTASVWIPEYFNEYLAIASNSRPKFWGMLNTKYVYSADELNVEGLRFIKKFNKCDICEQDPVSDKGIDGPFLYYNEKYLPRTYITNNSIIVVGEKNAVKQTSYALMLNENFNPASTVIIMGEKGLINNYNIDFLKEIKSIFLTQGSVDQNSAFILKQYVDSGGTLLPDITKGENSITNENINKILSDVNRNYSSVKKSNISYYSPNKIVIDLNGKKGFLVLAEKFFMFEGWHAKINGKEKEILRANGINSAVYLNNEFGKIVFEYKPKSFRNGLIISLITLSLIIAYFIYDWRKNKK